MKSRESELTILYLLFDLIILNLSILLMVSVSKILSFQDHYTLSSNILHANLSWLITYFIFSKKNLFLRDGFYNRFKRITQRVLIFLVVALILAYLFMPRTTYSRVFLLEYTLLFYLGKLLYFYSLYRYLRIVRSKGIHVNRAVIIGMNQTGLALCNLIKYNPMLGYKFLGYISDDENDNTEVLGKTAELETLIQKHRIEMLFVTISILDESLRTKELLRLCNQMGVRLRFIPVNQHWFKNNMNMNMNMESVDRLVLINPQEIPLDDIESQFYKRLFDIVFSFLVIVFLLSWMIPLLAILIKLNSRGPVFFVQQRTGINNKIFKCYKFRSMQVNPEANEKQATVCDNRINSVGRFIRKYNIDELPQFINVFFGQMSVVGPRPHMLKHTEQYSKLIESYLVRHYIKPGITGWAQVSGYRGETNELWKMEKRVEYDMNYLENWNLWWDIKIVFLTLFGLKSLKIACQYVLER